MKVKKDLPKNKARQIHSQGPLTSLTNN